MLSILEAFTKADTYLRGAEAQRFAVRGITLCTDRGLVEFRLDADRVVGQVVHA